MNAKRTAKAGVVTKIRTWDPIQTTLTRRQINWTKASVRTALQVLGVRGESGMTLSRLQNNADNRSTENIAAVSRFVPRKGHNFELLSSGKLDTLGVKGQGNGMLLSLAAEEVCTNRSGHSLFECALTLKDIYLAGTFSITPIQGRVSFYGTILSPTTDDRAYPVYSPVSHAVSAISFSDTSSSTTSQLLSQIRLPDTLSLSGRALILVRGTATGLDGMRGGAIPGFATAWGDEKGWMGVKGVHSVSSASNECPVQVLMTARYRAPSLPLATHINNPKRGPMRLTRYTGTQQTTPSRQLPSFLSKDRSALANLQ